MYEVGDKLKDARMAKGYTLDELQQITKIQKRYLTAIEEGHLEVLPGDFYVRAFIKQYAEAVGLDGDQLVEEYIGSSSSKSSRENSINAPAQSRIKNKEGGVWATIKDSLPMILIVVLIIAIVVAIYVASAEMNNGEDGSMINEQEETVNIRNNDEANSEEDSAEDSTEDSSNDADEESTETSEDSQSLEVESSTDTFTDYTIVGPHPDNQTVEMSADNGRTWVSITVDGEVQEEGVLEDEQNFEVDLNSDVSEVELIVGNASATQISLNGEEVNYSEDSDVDLRQEIHFNFESEEE